MGIIVKADRDRDLYMEWSSTVESPTAIGTRAEMLDYLTHHQGFLGGPADSPEERLARADENGSSTTPDPLAPGYTGPLDGNWDDSGFIVEQCGWLPRARLAEFLDAMQVDKQQAFALLDPFDDDSEASR